ncbi:sensor domain-containing diguanylate cyclase [Mangrovicella endophytica]|uniref:sensor domain-containing diguanylate cyclase n=1 Tax=Mangrovicella endophytica TaxID=2066697 RepID=UPI0012FFF11F|nr:sensor domain-containing diguanylate cyclase [Mangrovicella endophytica]
MRDELISLLFAARAPLVIIGSGVATSAALLAYQQLDVTFAAIAALAALVTAGRVVLATAYRQQRHALSMQAWERIYAAGNFSIASLIGLFGVHALPSDVPLSHLLATGVLFSYGAGLVARISVRPWMCYASLLIAAAPFLLTMGLHPDAATLPLGALILLMLGGSLGTVAHTRRITEEHIRTRLRFADLARSDLLTGLPNRLLLEERLEEAIAGLSGDRRVSLLFLDLDHFKEANDRFGHHVGDLLLREVGVRLQALIRRNDIVARLGGDEFVVLQTLEGNDSEAEMTARRIVRGMHEPFDVDGHEIHVGVSVGIAVAPRNGLDPAALLAAADGALYEAKRRGRGTVSFAGSGAPASVARTV